MGYRTYIGSISKKEYDKIKTFNQERLCVYKNLKDKDDYVGAYDIVAELYEFGKYTEFDDKKFFKPFWKNKKFQEYYEGDFWIVERKFLNHIIEHYKEKIISHYNKLLDCSATDRTHQKHGVLTIKEEEIKNISSEKAIQWFNHIKDMRSEWTYDFALDLKDEKDRITGSWKYEYSIFELVRIYKTFDWENDVMVYYGF